MKLFNRAICGALASLFLSGCAPYLSVKKEVVNRHMLASTFVDTPDPRQTTLKTGERLVIHWHLSPFDEGETYHLTVTVLHRNLQEEVHRFPIEKRWGIKTVALLGEKYQASGGWLTYRAEMTNHLGEPCGVWEHQLWKNLIHICDP